MSSDGMADQPSTSQSIPSDDAKSESEVLPQTDAAEVEDVEITNEIYSEMSPVPANFEEPLYNNTADGEQTNIPSLYGEVAQIPPGCELCENMRGSCRRIMDSFYLMAKRSANYEEIKEENANIRRQLGDTNKFVEDRLKDVFSLQTELSTLRVDAGLAKQREEDLLKQIQILEVKAKESREHAHAANVWREKYSRSVEVAEQLQNKRLEIDKKLRDVIEIASSNKKKKEDFERQAEALKKEKKELTNFSGQARKALPKLFQILDELVNDDSLNLPLLITKKIEKVKSMSSRGFLLNVPEHSDSGSDDDALELESLLNRENSLSGSTSKLDISKMDQSFGQKNESFKSPGSFNNSTFVNQDAINASARKSNFGNSHANAKGPPKFKYTSRTENEKFSGPQTFTKFPPTIPVSALSQTESKAPVVNTIHGKKGKTVREIQEEQKFKGSVKERVAEMKRLKELEQKSKGDSISETPSTSSFNSRSIASPSKRDFNNPTKTRSQQFYESSSQAPTSHKNSSMEGTSLTFGSQETVSKEASISNDLGFEDIGLNFPSFSGMDSFNDSMPTFNNTTSGDGMLSSLADDLNMSVSDIGSVIDGQDIVDRTAEEAVETVMENIVHEVQKPNDQHNQLNEVNDNFDTFAMEQNVEKLDVSLSFSREEQTVETTPLAEERDNGLPTSSGMNQDVPIVTQELEKEHELPHLELHGESEAGPSKEISKDNLEPAGSVSEENEQTLSAEVHIESSQLPPSPELQATGSSDISTSELTTPMSASTSVENMVDESLLSPSLDVPMSGDDEVPAASQLHTENSDAALPEKGETEQTSEMSEAVSTKKKMLLSDLAVPKPTDVPATNPSDSSSVIDNLLGLNEPSSAPHPKDCPPKSTSSALPQPSTSDSSMIDLLSSFNSNSSAPKPADVTPKVVRPVESQPSTSDSSMIDLLSSFNGDSSAPKSTDCAPKIIRPVEPQPSTSDSSMIDVLLSFNETSSVKTSKVQTKRPIVKKPVGAVNKEETPTVKKVTEVLKSREVSCAVAEIPTQESNTSKKSAWADGTKRALDIMKKMHLELQPVLDSIPLSPKMQQSFETPVVPIEPKKDLVSPEPKDEKMNKQAKIEKCANESSDVKQPVKEIKKVTSEAPKRISRVTNSAPRTSKPSLEPKRAVKKPEQSNLKLPVQSDLVESGEQDESIGGRLRRRAALSIAQPQKIIAVPNPSSVPNTKTGETLLNFKKTEDKRDTKLLKQPESKFSTKPQPTTNDVPGDLFSGLRKNTRTRVTASKKLLDQPKEEAKSVSVSEPPVMPTAEQIQVRPPLFLDTDDDSDLEIAEPSESCDLEIAEPSVSCDLDIAEPSVSCDLEIAEPSESCELEIGEPSECCELEIGEPAETAAPTVDDTTQASDQAASDSTPTSDLGNEEPVETCSSESPQPVETCSSESPQPASTSDENKQRQSSDTALVAGENVSDCYSVFDLPSDEEEGQDSQERDLTVPTTSHGLPVESDAADVGCTVTEGVDTYPEGVVSHKNPCVTPKKLSSEHLLSSTPKSLRKSSVVSPAKSTQLFIGSSDDEDDGLTLHIEEEEVEEEPKVDHEKTPELREPPVGTLTRSARTARTRQNSVPKKVETIRTSPRKRVAKEPSTVQPAAPVRVSPITKEPLRTIPRPYKKSLTASTTSKEEESSKLPAAATVSAAASAAPTFPKKPANRPSKFCDISVLNKFTQSLGRGRGRLSMSTRSRGATTSTGRERKVAGRESIMLDLPDAPALSQPRERKGVKRPNLPPVMQPSSLKRIKRGQVEEKVLSESDLGKQYFLNAGLYLINMKTSKDNAVASVLETYLSEDQIASIKRLPVEDLGNVLVEIVYNMKNVDLFHQVKLSFQERNIKEIRNKEEEHVLELAYLLANGNIFITFVRSLVQKIITQETINPNQCASYTRLMSHAFLFDCANVEDNLRASNEERFQLVRTFFNTIFWKHKACISHALIFFLIGNSWELLTFLAEDLTLKKLIVAYVEKYERDIIQWAWSSRFGESEAKLIIPDDVVSKLEEWIAEERMIIDELIPTETCFSLDRGNNLIILPEIRKFLKSQAVLYNSTNLPAELCDKHLNECCSLFQSSLNDLMIALSSGDSNILFADTTNTKGRSLTSVKVYELCVNIKSFESIIGHSLLERESTKYRRSLDIVSRTLNNIRFIRNTLREDPDIPFSNLLSSVINTYIDLAQTFTCHAI